MADEGKVITVSGPIVPEALGVCLTHEHLLFNWVSAYWEEPTGLEEKALANSPITLGNRGILNRNLLAIKENLVQSDVRLASEEVKAFKRAGGGTIVEVTPIAQGRDPRGLLHIAQESEMNLVMSTGFYVQEGHPSYVKEKTAEELAAMMIEDVTQGVDGTNIRAGYIKVGTSSELTEDERKVLRACARTHFETGVAIGVHIDPTAWEALNVIKILFEEGVKPHRIVMVHMDEHPDSLYHQAIADKGVYVEFDTWGTEIDYDFPSFFHSNPKDVRRVECAKFLLDRGYVDQMLISQDIWLKQMLRAYGGHGYDHFLRWDVPLLKRAGVSEEQIDAMLVKNPMRVLPLAVS